MATTVHPRPSSAFEFRDVTAGEAKTSGVSWGAVIAGAFVTAALSLILLALGTGMGFSAMMWGGGSSGRAVGVGAIIWLVVTEIICSGVGGYLAGWLRTRWVALHTHGVCFRDTPHGFLVWAVSLVISAALLTSAAAAMVGVAASCSANGGANSPAVQAAMSNISFTDELLRTNNTNAPQNQAGRDEANLILLNAVAKRDLAAPDRFYLVRLVAAQTGLPPAEANSRVSDVSTTTSLRQTRRARRWRIRSTGRLWRY